MKDKEMLIRFDEERVMVHNSISDSLVPGAWPGPGGP